MPKLSSTKTRKAFAEIIQKDPGNKLCADCHAPNPSWVSTNIGIFLCIKCASVHRSMGTQTSKIRSSALDYWEEPQMENLKRVGNTRAARVWEARLPSDFIRPGNKAHPRTRETFIREKYEKKRWFDKEEYERVYLGKSAKKTTKNVTRNLISFEDCEGKFENLYRTQQMKQNS